jgi:hypothetical protein
MYAGSVQGLRRIGELQYEAQETRRATLYALTTNDSNLQVEYADQSRGADRLVTEESRSTSWKRVLRVKWKLANGCSETGRVLRVARRGAGGDSGRQH